MSAEVTFLGGVIFRVDENRVVRARSHARLATDADRFIEINDAVSAFEHRRRRARRHTRRMSALIAARHLMRASSLRKLSDINMLDVGARHGERHFVFGFAGGRAGVTTDAARMVYDFSPLNLLGGGMDGEFSHLCAHLNLTSHPAPTDFSIRLHSDLEIDLDFLRIRI